MKIIDGKKSILYAGEDLDEPINYKDLIKKYHQSRVASKKTISKSSSSSSINKATPSGMHRGTSSHHYFSVCYHCPIKELV